MFLQWRGKGWKATIRVARTARRPPDSLGQFDSHMNRANMDALAGRPHPHDIFVRKYATNKHAAQLADYYRRTTPAMGGPRTAAWYTHYYGVSDPRASGTEGQMA